MLNENCLKVLESLIRNFNIHRYEQEECIINFMAFHSTPTYVRLLQNINLKSKISWNHFLNNIVRKGETITRDLFVNQVLLDATLLDRVIKYVKEKTELCNAVKKL